jgi:hypothetical protein
MVPNSSVHAGWLCAQGARTVDDLGTREAIAAGKIRRRALFDALKVPQLLHNGGDRVRDCRGRWKQYAQLIPCPAGKQIPLGWYPSEIAPS